MKKIINKRQISYKLTNPKCSATQHPLSVVEFCVRDNETSFFLKIVALHMLVPLAFLFLTLFCFFILTQ